MENIKEKLVKGSAGQYLFIITQTIVGIFKVSIGIEYFGSEVYGIWLVISSIISYLSLSQMGIGPTLITLLSQNKGNKKNQKAIIINSIKLLCVVSLIIIIVTILLDFLYPSWIKLFFNVKKVELKQLALYTTSLMILFTAIKIPFVVFKSSFSGLQKVFWNKVYNTLGSISSLLALGLTVYLEKSLIHLAIFTGVLYIIVGVLSGIHLIKKFTFIKPFSKDGNYYFPKSVLLKTGMKFFILSITSTIIIQTDNIIISSIKGPNFVTPYALTFKVYFIMLNLINSLSAGLWPVSGSLFADKKWDKINRLYNEMAMIIILFGGLAWIGGINFADLVIKFWVGTEGYAGFLTSFVLGGFVFISSFIGGVNTPIINGSNPDKNVLIMSILEGISNLILSLVLIRYFGIAGVAMATFISRVLFRSWFGPFYIKVKTKGNVVLNLEIILKELFMVLVFIMFSVVNKMSFISDIINFGVGIVLTLGYTFLSIKYLLKNNHIVQEIYYPIKNKFI